MKLNYFYKNQKIIITIFVCTLLASIIPYLPNYQKSSTNIKRPIIIETQKLEIIPPNSNEYPSKQFHIQFPSPPSYSCREQLLPKLSQKPITLHQYVVKEGVVEYKVYTTVLPKKCFRWSKNIILHGTLKVLAQNTLLPTKILNTTFKKSEKYPILEYRLRQETGKIQTIGKLILVDSSIYLIEVTLPEIALTSNSYKKIEKFIQSFELSCNFPIT